ncbi:RRP12-like protein isoform X1 [Porites lutea]|uniref:RRP12-like protein isoform X1 n=1 Tax=Porites lutea TaxID=51062 RepID=UPI003CC61390
MVRLRKGKTKRWRKGQSCESNPAIKVHREAVKRGTIVGQATRNSNLTVEALARHAVKHDEDGNVELKDDEGVSMKSGQTFGAFSVSGLTDCSNPVFAAVRRFWDSPATQHKEVCAVLAAVTEVIKSKGGKESETEYFAALMTALESADEIEAVTAITFLLSLVIKSVPDAILKAKFSKSCQVLVKILSAHASDGAPGLLRPLLGCLCRLLGVQEGAVWSESSTMTIYNGLLSFVIHSKPKVRKAAQEAVTLLLKKPPGDLLYHPASSATVKFCVKQIEEHGGSAQGAVTTLHVIGVLKEILPLLPGQNVKTVCECLLKLMTLGNVMVTVNSLQAIYKLLCASPDTSTLGKQLNAQLINALYDYQPSINDEDPSQAWISTMEKAYVNLGRLDAVLGYNHIPRFFNSLMNYYLSDHLALATAVQNTMKTLLLSLAPIAEEVCAEVTKSPGASNTPLQKIIKCMESGLQYRYQASWASILEVIKVTFEVFGKYCPKLLKKLLTSLCDLRGIHQFPHINKLDQAVGMAIQKMGPRLVLEAVPLQLDKELSGVCNFPRSWLLPVLKDNVKDTELKYFFDVMLPLSANLRTKAISLRDAGKLLESKVYDTLQLQIWDLLPGFCTRPTDLCQSFKSVARILGVALTERPDLRLTVCQALRLLVLKSSDNAENSKELSSYAKNYLPILFNLYTAEEKEGDPDKLPILETVRVYLSITDSKLVATFFAKGLEKLSSGERDAKSRNLMMDLVIAMTPYVNEKNIGILYDMAVPWLQATDVTQQKKAYRIFEQICGADSESSLKFVVSHLKELQDILLKTLASSSSASKTPRLRCLAHIVRRLDKPEQFIQAIIPEVILCTKEVAVKARSSAFTLLIECCNARFRSSDKSRQECLTSFLELVVAGIAGSPHMISATVISVARVVYEFRSEIPSVLLEQLIQGILVCLRSVAREVIKSCLGFFKVIISVMNQQDLLPYVPDIVGDLVAWNDDTRRRFRFNVRVLFERLIRKFGYHTIYKCTPEQHQKLVHNIHKTTQRLKRQKMAARRDRNSHEGKVLAEEETPQIESYEDIMFGDDEGEERPGMKAKKKANMDSKTNQRAKAPKAWIREGTDEEPVDFLDPKVVQRVVASDPTKPTKRKKTDDFETSADGKLIIRDDESENELQEPGAKRKRKPGFQDSDDDMDENPSLRKKKRKSFEADAEEEGENQGLPSKRGKSEKPFGSEYKARKAGGDVKKKGKPDPFAYVPLQRNVLNKRKQRKMAGQFRGLVRATKRGAANARPKKAKR